MEVRNRDFRNFNIKRFQKNSLLVF